MESDVVLCGSVRFCVVLCGSVWNLMWFCVESDVVLCGLMWFCVV